MAGVMVLSVFAATIVGYVGLRNTHHFATVIHTNQIHICQLARANARGQDALNQIIVEARKVAQVSSALARAEDAFLAQQRVGARLKLPCG